MCGTAKTKNFVTESTEKGDFVFMKKQQWMSLLLAAAMAVSVLPAGAFAEEADEAAGGTQAAVVLEQEQAAPNTTEVQPAGTVSDETEVVALVNGEACADLQAAYELTDNKDGTWTAGAVLPVAKVNGVGYPTLVAAVAAVTGSESKAGTVTLLENAQGGGIGLFNAEGAEGVDLTIDLGGHTYTCVGPAVGSSGTKSQAFHLEKGNKVTVKNGTVAISEENNGVQMMFQNYGGLTLQDLSLKGAQNTQYIISCNYGDTVLTNVNIDGTHAELVALDVMHWLGTTYEDKAPTVTVNNTKANTINGKLDVYCYGAGDESCTAKPTLSITGGTFSNDPSAYVAEGYVVTDNKDGTWTAGAVLPVAKVNGVGYPTLVAAVAAVTGSESKAGTVTLLENAQGGGIGLFNAEGAEGVDLTIDLGGHTYTCVGPAVGSSGTKSQAFHLEKGNKVTVKNGTVAISEENNGVQMMFQNYGGLTLQDLSLKGAQNTQYIISCNYGDTVLTNVNIDGTHAELVALDVMHWLGTTYEDKAPTVTVNNTKANTINGKLDVYCYGAGAESCTAKPTLSITGGTFRNDPSAYVAEGYVVSGNETESYTVSKYVAPTPTPDHGQGGGSQATPAPTATPAPVPTATPAPTATARPQPTARPQSTATPAPSETPVVTDGTVTASTKTDAVVENATAVAAIENEQLAEAVEAALSDAEAAGAAPVVQVEVSRTEGAEAVEVTLPADALTTLAAREDAELVVTSDVARVAFDSAALTAITQQAEQEIVLSVSPVAPAQLNEAQAAAADGFPVVELTLRSGDTVISDFSAGTATVTLPYALADGQQAEGVVVWYVDDNGGTTPCDTSYNEAEGLVTFTTPHFSKYAIAYDETLVPAAPEEQPVISVPDPEADKGGLPVLPMAIGAIAVVLIVLAVVLRLLFKRRDDEQGY